MDRNKLKILSYLICMLWIAAFTQLMVNHFFMREERIINAFANTETNVVESRLELTAYYGEKKLSKIEKQQLLGKIAACIGLKSGYTVSIKKDDTANIITGKKIGQDAKTTIKIVSIKQNKIIKQYILVYLNIFNKTESILQYKKMLEKEMNRMKVEDYQTLLRFNGCCKGKLTEKEKDKAVNGMLNSLQAKVVGSNSDNGIRNVYAYTGLLGEYLQVNKCKVNVNVAVTYDELKKQTNIYLATPILNGDY